MDEKGVHFSLNAKKSTVPDVGTASPAQTVIGKDKLNPLMAVTFPKSEDQGCSSSKTKLTRSGTKIKKTLMAKRNNETIVRQTLDKFFSSQTQDKYINEQANEQPTNPDEEQPTNPDGVVPEQNNADRNTSSSYEDNNFQFKDAQDPYEDDDSGMSFDSIALHNLDT
ncbi:hypothetical protein P3S67_028683 [Capsicum chacoense]